ncbi:MAG: hypothetical protein ACKVQJ_15370 [Pyrinomonadaceae bacterium]
MVTIDEVMPMLVEACPTFRQTYEGLIDLLEEPDWEYLMDDFADHIFNLYENGETDEFIEVFKIIESVKSEGDDATKELVQTFFYGEVDRLVSKRKGN